MPEPNSHAQVLSLGSINADFQMRVARRPEISETLLAHDFVRLSGGKSANVAYIARKLGVPATLLAHCGDDDLAQQVLTPLREIGVDLSGVKTLPGQHTGVAVILVPPDGKKGIVMAANANDVWGEDDLPRVLLAVREAAPGSVLVCNCEIPVDIVVAALREARRVGVRTVLDPSPGDRVTDELLALTDLVTPNPSEAKTLTGIAFDDPQGALEAARRLLARGAAAACVKLPDGGCVYVREGCVAHIGATEVDVEDTTGAGDAFAGALAATLAQGADDLDAARCAVAAAHLAVGTYGSQAGYPAREQLDQMEERLPINKEIAPHA